MGLKMSLLETLKFRVICKRETQNNQHFLYIRKAPFSSTVLTRQKKEKYREMHWIVQLEHLLTAGLWEKRPRQHFPKPEYWSSQHEGGR